MDAAEGDRWIETSSSRLNAVTGTPSPSWRGRGDRLMQIAQRILRNVGRAEDVVQQTLVIAWRELPSLRLAILGSCLRADQRLDIVPSDDRYSTV